MSEKEAKKFHTDYTQIREVLLIGWKSTLSNQKH